MVSCLAVSNRQWPPMNASDDAHLTETLLDSQALCDGSFLKARCDTVRLHDGRQALREYIVHPGAVVIIAMLDDGRELLERQLRYPVVRVMTEVPAGKQIGSAPARP